MLSWLGDAIAAVFEWLFDWLKTIWDSTLVWVTVLWGFVVGFFSWVYDTVTQVLVDVGSVITAVTELFSSESMPGSSGQPSAFLATWQFANAWLPLSEMVGMIVVLYGLRKVLVLYRMVKSWIPSLSG